MKLDLTRLSQTITAPDAVYNCHGYLTKVPIAAIEPFIEAFTDPGEVIADLFAGSGMTGLAAMRLGRQAKLSDISVLGRHIAQGYTAQVAHDQFEQAAKDVVAEARAAIGDLYDAKRADDLARVEMVRTVWSFTYACPGCDEEIVYFAELLPTGAAPEACARCKQRSSAEAGRDVMMSPSRSLCAIPKGGWLTNLCPTSTRR